MENKPFTDTDNIPPAPDQLTKDIWEAQFPYLSSKGLDPLKMFEEGYRAAVKKLSGEDWISVEKEKPGHNQIVDAYDGKNRRCQYDAETKQFYRHTDFCDGDRLMRPYYPNVTHWKWIDFPEPPKP